MTASPTSAPPDGPALGEAAADAADAPASGRLAGLVGRGRNHRHLLQGSGVLVLGAAVQGFGGLVFSVLASKLDAKADFGDATALFTSVLFVTYLAGLGLPVALARYAAGRDRDSDVVFTWAVVVTVPAAVVASAAYLWVIHPGAADVLWEIGTVPGFLLFAGIVVGSALSLIFDVRAMTVRRWNVVLVRICIVAVAKVALLPVAQGAADRSLLLFVYLGGPVAISGIVGVAMVHKIAGGRHRLGPRPPTARAAVRYSAVNYLSTLAYQAPYFALPVIVLTHVDSATNGSFYVAWGIVAIAFYVPSAIGQALLAEGGKGGAHVRGQMRLAMTMAVGLMGLGALATWSGKGLVIQVFDATYQDAAHILPAMMLAGIPWAITSLLLTEARVLHRHVATVTITLVLTASIIVPALVLVPDDGLDGASAAWLAGNTFAAVVAIVVTAVSRRSAGSSHVADDLDPLAPVE